MAIKKKPNIDIPPDIDTSTEVVIDEVISPTKARVSFPDSSSEYIDSLKNGKTGEEKFANEYLLTPEWVPMENNDWEMINLRERREKDAWLRYEIEWDWEAVVWSSEKVEAILTPVQELFCQYYCNVEVTRFNATMSYSEAYWYDLDGASRVQVKDKNTQEIIRESEYRRMYRTCSVNGTRLLRNAKIQDRITVLMNELKKDEVVDRKMMQHILWPDNQSSRDMIKEYNKLMQRITDKTKDESESDKAKADLFKTLEWQVKTMSKEELSGTIQDLLTPKR